jgi:hypothetical protein
MQERRLERLSPSHAAWYSSAESTTGSLHREGCTPNTRVAMLRNLRGWAYNNRSTKLCWLSGMAGTGKTTIAYSLCDELDATSILVASFFCSRHLPECRNFNLIIPTISYHLARFSLPFRYALSGVLEQNPDVHKRKLSDQFEKLILLPLQEVKHTLPTNLVVVLDALDECENHDGVSQILHTLLSREASELPIKFFVTSRPEAKILDWMRSHQGERAPAELRLHELELSVVQEDIKAYLKVALEPVGPSEAQLVRLVEQAGVLFVYASNMVRYIGAGNFSRKPQKRLAAVLSASPSSNSSHRDIDALYTTILAAAFDNLELDDSDRDEMRLVLETVLCAREPLLVSVIAGVLKLDDEDSVRSALRPLLSVLHISEPTGLVTTLHGSFPDYMMDEQRSGKFYCDMQRCNARFAQLCFDTLKIPDPPFNICGLESSYMFDKDVPDLTERVNKAIPKELFYACRYWGAHLELAEASPLLIGELHDFLSVRFLFWMEILNLKQCIHTAPRLLLRIHAWSQVGS